MNTPRHKVSLTEISFHPASFADPNGRLFVWQGQIYRGISYEHSKFVKGLFQSGLIRELINKSLIVQTEIADIEIDGYGLLLKHQTVPFVSYAYEWSAEMLKDAALLMLELLSELSKHNLTLQDAHPWNVLFDGPRPVYVDFGSIIPDNGKGKWRGYKQFLRYFLNPLRLSALGYGQISRCLFSDYRMEISNFALESFLFKKKTGRANQTFFSLARKLIKKSPAGQDFIRDLKHTINNIVIPSKRTDWSDYYNHGFPPLTPTGQWAKKQHSVYHVLKQLQPGSVLDVGSNRGWYSQLAASLGSQVVSFDVDEPSISMLYREAQQKKMPILPLIMDFRNPSPGYGLCNQTFPPATQRLKCDLVIAAALVHHLVFRQYLHFEQIVSGLSLFAKQWLLVEFIPKEDVYVSKWWTQKYSWYTLDNFILTLKKEFPCVQVYPSSPEPRVFLLCKRIADEPTRNEEQ